jgi:hypothetical protein
LRHNIYFFHMKYRNIIIALGFLVFILPILGFPQTWDNMFYALAGLLIIAFSYLSGKKESLKETQVPVETVATVSSNIGA